MQNKNKNESKILVYDKMVGSSYARLPDYHSKLTQLVNSSLAGCYLDYIFFKKYKTWLIQSKTKKSHTHLFVYWLAKECGLYLQFLHCMSYICALPKVFRTLMVIFNILINCIQAYKDLKITLNKTYGWPLGHSFLIWNFKPTVVA